MKSSISVGGSFRLRQAIEAEVRREFALELASAKNFFAKLAVEKKIWSEVKKRLRQTTSPHALYLSAAH
jgi:hypothetical protein